MEILFCHSGSRFKRSVIIMVEFQTMFSEMFSCHLEGSCFDVKRSQCLNRCIGFLFIKDLFALDNGVIEVSNDIYNYLVNDFFISQTCFTYVS